MAALSPELVASLFSQLVSATAKLAAFEQVISHEPKAAPVSLPAMALWWNGIGPARGLSGLDATSARCEFRARVYLDAKAKPEDKTEEKLLYLSSVALGAYSGGFTLGGEAVAVDLLGGWGEPLSADPGWLEHDDRQYRISEIVIPVLLDGTWAQVP